MEFTNVTWLITGAVICIAITISFYYYRRRARFALTQFAAPRLIAELTMEVSPFRQNIRIALIIAAVFFICVALAKPQIGYYWQQFHRKGIDVLIALDTSKSMLAEDIAPNRLSRSKLAIRDLVANLKGDRVGLIPFTSSAFLMTPLTLDYQAFNQSLTLVDTATIPVAGTNLAMAIKEAEHAFGKVEAHKVLVLITDGEDLEGEALKVAKSAASRGVIVHTIGVGSNKGELIPVKSKDGGVTYLKDENGKPVLSRLDDSTLKAIAEITGGSYHPLGLHGEGLEQVYQDMTRFIPQKEFEERARRVPVERFEWALLLAFLLLMVEFALGGRRRNRSRVASAAKPIEVERNRAAVSGMLAATVVLVTLFFITPETVLASPSSAKKDYDLGRYSEAFQMYQDLVKSEPENSKLQFNLGAAAYKVDEFEVAANAFKKVIAGNSAELKIEAQYNLGNTFYRQGSASVEKDPQASVSSWKRAIEQYERALELNPKEEDVKFNKDFVERKLKQLIEKQKEETPPESDTDEKQNKNSDISNTQGRAAGKEGDDGLSNSQDENQSASEELSQEGQQQENKEDMDKEANTKGTHALNDKDNSQSEPGKIEANSIPKEEAGLAQDESSDEVDNRREGDLMTASEAKRLLDSLRDDEAKMPLFSTGVSDGLRKERAGRDW